MENNRVMGIHKGGKIGDNYNIGLFIKYGINEFINSKTKLDLSDKNLGNDELKQKLENMDLKEIKELYLFNNNISDLKLLKEFKIEKLEVLNLSWNNISNNINIIENKNFKELRQLYLYHNNISNIKVIKYTSIRRNKF